MTRRDKRIRKVRNDVASQLHVMVDRVCGYPDDELSAKRWELITTRDAKRKAIDEIGVFDEFLDFLFDETQLAMVNLLKSTLLHSESRQCPACGRLYSVDYESVCRHCGATVSDEFGDEQGDV